MTGKYCKDSPAYEDGERAWRFSLDAAVNYCNTDEQCGCIAFDGRYYDIFETTETYDRDDDDECYRTWVII